MGCTQPGSLQRPKCMQPHAHRPCSPLHVYSETCGPMELRPPGGERRLAASLSPAATTKREPGRTTRPFEPAAPGRRVRAEVLTRELREHLARGLVVRPRAHTRHLHQHLARLVEDLPPVDGALDLH